MVAPTVVTSYQVAERHLVVTVVSQDGRLHFPLGPHHKPTRQIPIYLPPRCAA